ncbi:MAG: aminotransferase class I/II-fold pyridoxal phosphate-dependent enzyme [Ignavibacteria bacterium]|nr:aminotransferase class I/II-fold pyridoxal phosphate-dependent enzyme [Ignavibacteria bacterium]
MPNLIICRTFSKYFALAGTRMGFSFAGNNLEELKGYTTRYLGYNLVSENLSLIAYDDHKYYEKVTGMMQEDKEYFYSEFKKMKGFTPYKSFANFMLVDMPAGIRKDLDKFLKERNLLIKFLDEEAFKTETRITLGTREQNYYLIDSIKEFLKKLNTNLPIVKKQKRKIPDKKSSGAEISRYILLAVILIIGGYFFYDLVLREEPVKPPVFKDPQEKIKNVPEPQFKRRVSWSLSALTVKALT